MNRWLTNPMATAFGLNSFGLRLCKARRVVVSFSHKLSED